MLNVLLQVWGGLFFLLNKIFFSLKERSIHQRWKKRWQVWSWVVYLIGLPGWIIIFIIERNWIAASLEASGAPAMVLGLMIAIRGHGKSPRWLDVLAKVIMVAGIAYSLYDFGGLTTVTQLLEVVLVSAYLIGTYQLAHERANGYLCYIVMHVSCGWLMWIQNYPWLFWQQVVSLGFVLDAYFMWRKKQAAR